MTKNLIILIILLFIISPITANVSPKVIHVFVALCDNRTQGIVRVSKSLGDGNNLNSNLYWGAGAGVKTFFNRSKSWTLIDSKKNLSKIILERCVFKHKTKNAYLVADAYRGSALNICMDDFLKALANQYSITVKLKSLNIKAGSHSGLITYVGHDGFMDLYKPEILTWELTKGYPERKDNGKPKKAVLLCCKANKYFRKQLQKAKAYPLIWTTGLMCPEAYTLEAIAEGWLNNESDKQIHLRASKAYHKYQRCGLNGAKRLFKTGW